MVINKKWKGFLMTIEKNFSDTFFFLKIFKKKLFLEKTEYNLIGKLTKKMRFLCFDFRMLKNFLNFFEKIFQIQGFLETMNKEKPELFFKKEHFSFCQNFWKFLKTKENLISSKPILKNTFNINQEKFEEIGNNLRSKKIHQEKKDYFLWLFLKIDLKKGKLTKPGDSFDKKREPFFRENFLKRSIPENEPFLFILNKKVSDEKKYFVEKDRGFYPKKVFQNLFSVHRIFFWVRKNLKDFLPLTRDIRKNSFHCLKGNLTSISWGYPRKRWKKIKIFKSGKNQKEGYKYSDETININPKKKYIQINGIKYEKLELIGKGGTGKVYKIVDQRKNVFALKKVKIQNFGTENLHDCINEISILKILHDHPRVVQLKNAEISLKNRLIYMIFEYGECDLNRILKKNPISLTKDSFLKFLWRQILETVQAIHQERIVHGDLKPANFLIVCGCLKIIDFGIAKPIQNDTTNITRSSQIGTLNYMPPESVLDIHSFCERKKKFRLSRSADVWSLGCIFFQMVYGKTPFYHLTMMKKIQAIVSKTFEISFLPTKSFFIIDVLKNCLQRNPDFRPSIPELLKHPFFVSENLQVSKKK